MPKGDALFVVAGLICWSLCLLSRDSVEFMVLLLGGAVCVFIGIVINYRKWSS